jgi:hypothetical protein
MKKFIFRKYDSLVGCLLDYILAPYMNCSVEVWSAGYYVTYLLVFGASTLGMFLTHG